MNDLGLKDGVDIIDLKRVCDVNTLVGLGFSNAQWGNDKIDIKNCGDSESPQFIKRFWLHYYMLNQV